MAKEKKVCPHCGANMNEHTHSLNIPLCTALKILYEHAGDRPVNLKNLKFTRNQIDNFQKLRYWKLVEKHYDQKGKRVGGEWKITSLGKQFLADEVDLYKKVITYRGEINRYEGKAIKMGHVIEGYKMREDYARDAQAHNTEPRN